MFGILFLVWSSTHHIQKCKLKVITFGDQKGLFLLWEEIKSPSCARDKQIDLSLPCLFFLFAWIQRKVFLDKAFWKELCASRNIYFWHKMCLLWFLQALKTKTKTPNGIKRKSNPFSANGKMVGAMLTVGHFKACCMDETVILRGRTLDLQSQSLSLRSVSTT